MHATSSAAPLASDEAQKLFQNGYHSMQSADRNLLLNLFAWRPRQNITPAENFLTEAFAHALRQNREFRSNWLGEILGQSVDDGSLIIETRASYPDVETGTTIFPDIEIRGDLTQGAPFILLIEVKWGARYFRSQLKRYDALLISRPNAHLAFLCASDSDYNVASRDAASLVHAEFHPILWETVFVSLQNWSENCLYSKDLLEFMHHHGLSPGEPISESMADAFIASKKIFERFRRYTEKLRREFDWSFLPVAYRDTESAKITDRYGRVAIEFAPYRHGVISIGFLYDNRDHRVPFADGSSNSIDLMMRIEASPKARGRDLVSTAIEAKAAELRHAGGVFRLNSDGTARNRHTLFIAQRSLADFLKYQTEREQLRAMHDQVKTWSQTLFVDHGVGESLQQWSDRPEPSWIELEQRDMVSPEARTDVPLPKQLEGE